MRFRLNCLVDPRLHMLVIAVLVGMIGLWRQAKEQVERDDPINKAIVVYVRAHAANLPARHDDQDRGHTRRHEAHL
jgi:hypothetical protein